MPCHQSMCLPSSTLGSNHHKINGWEHLSMCFFAWRRANGDGETGEVEGSVPPVVGGVILLLLEGGPHVMEWDGAWLCRSVDPLLWPVGPPILWGAWSIAMVKCRKCWSVVTLISFLVGPWIHVTWSSTLEKKHKLYPRVGIDFGDLHMDHSHLGGLVRPGGPGSVDPPWQCPSWKKLKYRWN
jgi:hypothetical protein